MTAPTPEKIQRYTEQLEGSNMVAHKDGEWVDYWDHLRAVTLAKIEVLEEMLSRLGGYSNSTKGYCEAKIAALRKEIG